MTKKTKDIIFWVALGVILLSAHIWSITEFYRYGENLGKTYMEEKIAARNASLNKIRESINNQ